MIIIYQLADYKNIIENILKDKDIFLEIDLILKNKKIDIIGIDEKYETKENNKNNDNAIKIYIGYISNMIYQKYHCKYEHYLSNNLHLNNYYNYHSDEFINALSNANYGYGTWEPGWEILQIVDNEQLKISRNNLTLWIKKNQLIPHEKKDYIEGENGFLWIGKEFRQLLPGFYSALSDIPYYQSNNKDYPTLRIYWNIRLEFSIKLTEYLTQELNTMRIPFFFKVLRDPNGFSRTDAAVLYINKSYFKQSINSIMNIYNKVNNYLNPETSIFTKYISPGFALAEEPIGLKDESFGQHHSRVLAEAILIEKLDTPTTVNSLSDKIEKIIKFVKKKADIEFQKPYLNPGSCDDDYKILKNKIETLRR